MNHDNKLSFAEKLGYGMGMQPAVSFTFGNHVSDMVLYGYLRAFCCRSRSDVPVTRVLDAITDPLTGIVADRVKTRWGHFRPWLIWFAVPYAVLAVRPSRLRNLAHRVNWFMPT